MAIFGVYRNGRYIPEPSVRAFEKFLGEIYSAMPCQICGQPLGGNEDCAAMIQVNHRKFHSACYRKEF